MEHSLRFCISSKRPAMLMLLTIGWHFKQQSFRTYVERWSHLVSQKPDKQLKLWTVRIRLQVARLRLVSLKLIYVYMIGLIGETSVFPLLPPPTFFFFLNSFSRWEKLGARRSIVWDRSRACHSTCPAHIWVLMHQQDTFSESEVPQGNAMNEIFDMKYSWATF